LIYVVWATRYQGRRSLGRLGRDRSRQQYLSHRFHDGFRCVPIIALRSGPSRVRSWSTPRSAPCVFLYLLSPWVEIGPVLPFPFLVREDSRLTRTPSSSVLAVERVLSGFWVLLLPLICEHCSRGDCPFAVGESRPFESTGRLTSLIGMRGLSWRETRCKGYP
jgi:hypothetical protein